MRIGQGLDVHRFSDEAGRPLVLGLVHVPDAPGLAGHSDADAATHALCDALLGAANLGDLGRHFPDDDPSLAGVSSRHLLEATLELLKTHHYRVVSADLTIVAQHPRLAPHMPAMSHELSSALGTPVSVKATTTEGLGAIGRGEGIGALAIVLVEETA